MLAESNCTNEEIVAGYCLSTSMLPNVGPSQVLPFLYLGSQDDALSTPTMKEFQITHVINVSVTGDRVPFLDENDNEHFLRIPIHDSLTEKLLPYLDDVYTFIEKARTNHGRVFIHCLAGISRSPTLAIAYVMRYLSLSVDDAYQFVKQRRSHISPNFNFIGQLSEYERRLGKCSKDNSTMVVVGKSCQTEMPLTERIRCISTETSANLNVEQVIRRPTIPISLDFTRFKSTKSHRLLSLPVNYADISQEKATSQTTKLVRPNSINFHIPAMKTEPTFSNVNSPRTNSTLKTTDNTSNKDKTTALSDSTHESAKKVPNNCTCHLLVS